MTEPQTQQLTGYNRLHNPRLNKGTAFTEAERRAYGLEGLLPPAVSTIDLQIARRRAEIANLGDDFLKYLVLSDLQARNERLFYAVRMSDPATYMPIVYNRRSAKPARSSAISSALRAVCICRSAPKAACRRYCATGRRKAIAHPAPASVSPGRLADITKRTVSNTEARLAFAVLTTERKAA